MSEEEPKVTMEIPQGAVDTITDFIAKRSLDVTTGLCLSVSLPDLGGPKSFAVFDISDNKWAICTKAVQNDAETNDDCSKQAVPIMWIHEYVTKLSNIAKSLEQDSTIKASLMLRVHNANDLVHSFRESLMRRTPEHGK